MPDYSVTITVLIGADDDTKAAERAWELAAALEREVDVDQATVDHVT